MSIRLAGLLVAILAAPAAAATVATPATIDAVLARAVGGDTIQLAAGTYPDVKLHDRRWSPSVTIDATAAQLGHVRFDRVSGLTWRGGNFDGGGNQHEGLKLEFVDHVNIDGATFVHHVAAGIAAGNISDSRLTNNVITDSGSDGIDVAMSRRVVVDHNRCTDFHARPGAHADCIQLWSKPTAPPTADIVVSNNEAVGDMQGFTAFNGFHDGVNEGGFDRILVEHNFAKVSSWHGIVLYDCRHCILRHNRVESLPNPQFPGLHSWIKVINGTDVVNCDNRAKDYPDDPGRAQCRDESRL